MSYLSSMEAKRMRRLISILALALLLLSGCVDGGQSYYYKVSGFEVYRSSFDIFTPEPKLDIDDFTVAKVAGTSTGLKIPSDNDNPNVEVILNIGDNRVEWRIRMDRGERQRFAVELQKLPEAGKAYFYTAGRQVNWRGQETDNWVDSDRKSKEYQVVEGQYVTYVSLEDERSIIEKLFNDYSDLLSQRVTSKSSSADWLDRKLSELEQKDNALSTFLKAYEGYVVAIVVTDYQGIVYRKIYQITSGRLVETSETPDVIIVLRDVDLRDIQNKFSAYEKNGWTPEEITKLEFLILERIEFQGDIRPFREVR